MQHIHKRTPKPIKITISWKTESLLRFLFVLCVMNSKEISMCYFLRLSNKIPHQNIHIRISKIHSSISLLSQNKNNTFESKWKRIQGIIQSTTTRTTKRCDPFTFHNYLPFIHVPLNGFHFRELPLISDNVIRLPFTREPSSSVRRREYEAFVCVSSDMVCLFVFSLCYRSSTQDVLVYVHLSHQYGPISEKQRGKRSKKRNSIEFFTWRQQYYRKHY